MSLKQIADIRWRQHKDYQINFALPKIGLRSWNPKFSSIVRSPERAEQWLRKIFTEIEDQLIKKPEEKRRWISRS